jgi:pimeloyl-ACP methyl ester carboxylesterase
MPADAVIIEKALDGRTTQRELKSTAACESHTAPPESTKADEDKIGAVTQDATAFADYLIDAAQRNILFWDALRQRANNMLEHERLGLPPLLKFKYEAVADAAEYDPPANYKLLKILEIDDVCLDDCLDPEKPPLMVIDPRAGHGPGIGGFKKDSEVGIALHEGYPVYFVVFAPDPAPGQTLADVLHALRRFVGTLSSLHGDRPPILYGNCQGGWAAALLAASCGGIAGPIVMNGSPLSYWAGEAGTNPMRLAGGFLGGSWMTHFLGDLGVGIFDGAWLVQNFENLKPESAIWRKYADLYLDIDSERDRFLDFERWWSGFYRFSREEMLAIVESLFIGNRLEKGLVEICAGCHVDLKDVRNPLVIFASYGDNITPPHQALGWIPAIYESTEELKDAGQRIVYLINQHAGHLGLFVSADVARFEHRAILESIADIESLAPGLYEMMIENPTGDPDCDRNQYSVRFKPRQVEDLSFDYPAGAFENAREVSQAAEGFYAKFFSPWVRACSNPVTAEALRWTHPMRASRYMFSEKLNPFMSIVAAAADMAEKSRRRRDPRNPFIEAERRAVDDAEAAIRRWRVARDSAGEQIFNWLYSWPTPASWFARPKAVPPQRTEHAE